MRHGPFWRRSCSFWRLIAALGNPPHGAVVPDEGRSVAMDTTSFRLVADASQRRFSLAGRRSGREAINFLGRLHLRRPSGTCCELTPMALLFSPSLRIRTAPQHAQITLTWSHRAPCRTFQARCPRDSPLWAIRDEACLSTLGPELWTTSRSRQLSEFRGMRSTHAAEQRQRTVPDSSRGRLRSSRKSRYNPTRPEAQRRTRRRVVTSYAAEELRRNAGGGNSESFRERTDFPGARRVSTRRERDDGQRPQMTSLLPAGDCCRPKSPPPTN